MIPCGILTISDRAAAGAYDDLGGPAVREAVRGMMRVELPGFGEAMRMVSFAALPNAILSRSLAAVVDDALVITLPGKPSGAVECLKIVAAAVPHTVKVARRVPTSC